MDKEKLIKDNIKLVYKLANKFYGGEKEDLINAGIMGICKAIKNYKKECGTKFSTYAYYDIIGEMHNLACQRQLKINKDILKLYKLIEKTRFLEAQKLGYIPNNLEISKILNININMIDYACNCATTVLSFDSDSEYERNLHETIPMPENLSNDDKILLYSSLEKLPKNEKIILEERYFNDETQSNVARKLKMTQVMVSRLEKKGLKKLHEYMV